MAKTIKDLTKAYTDVFYLEDNLVIRMLVDTVLTNLMPGDPVWVLLIGGSSSGKTELINTLTGTSWVKPISTLTPNTFLSGMRPQKGVETSLLLRFPRKFVIVFKDFTSVLSLNKEDLQEIMAQFRELYDGEMVKATGMGQELKWAGKAGMIAGSTEKIFLLDQKFSSAGVRFVYYTLPLQDRIKTTKRAAKIAQELPEMRKKLKEEFSEYILEMSETVTNFKGEIPENVSDELIEAANFASICRSPIERNFKGELEMVMSLELPMRLSNQLHKILLCDMAQHKGKLEKEAIQIALKIAFDSIPKARRVCLKKLAGYTVVSTKGLALDLGFPTDRVRMWLEEVNWLGICDRQKSTGNQGDEWTMKEEFRELMKKFDHVEVSGEKLYDPEMEAIDIANEETWNAV